MDVSDKIRILFLDYDGVMVTGGLVRSQRLDYWSWLQNHEHDAFGSPWHPQAVAALEYIIAQVPNLQLVISASDRVMGLDYQRGRWALRGYAGGPQIIVGITDPTDVPQRVRGVEIHDYLWALGAYYPAREWMVDYHILGRKDCCLSSYCILDDDSDMLYNQRKHFVKTNAETGLTMALAKRVVKILLRDKIFGV